MVHAFRQAVNIVQSQNNRYRGQQVTMTIINYPEKEGHKGKGENVCP